MRCEQCGSDLERPGDYCLICRSGSADAVVLVTETDRASLTMFDGEKQLGTTTLTTTPESGERHRERQQRDFVERIAEEVRRKRAEAMYVTGDRDLIHRLRREIAVPLYRIDADNPVESYLSGFGDPHVPTVDRDPAEKLGGRHTSLIGDRRGQRAIRLIADNPHVKKIIPGPIDASGQGSRLGFRASVTRATPDGNLRVLFRDGSSVQTVRVVTTAADHHTGERIGDQLNEGFRGEGIGR